MGHGGGDGAVPWLAPPTDQGHFDRGDDPAVAVDNGLQQVAVRHDHGPVAQLHLGFGPDRADNPMDAAHPGPVGPGGRAGPSRRTQLKTEYKVLRVQRTEVDRPQRGRRGPVGAGRQQHTSTGDKRALGVNITHGKGLQVVEYDDVSQPTGGHHPQVRAPEPVGGVVSGQPDGPDRRHPVTHQAADQVVHPSVS